VTWLLSGAAFVAVIAMSGCQIAAPRSLDENAREDSAKPTTRPAVAIADAAPDAQAAPIPPRVNIFGEFGGVEHPSARPGGAAGFQQHTWIDEGYDGDVAVDPKGQFLVYSSTRDSEHANIFMQKVSGLSVTQLTSGDADDAFPVFSPDGSKIAFCSTRAGNWDIYVMDADGHNVVQVTNTPMQEIHPSFSPDSNKLTYCALSNRSGQWEIWTANLVSGEKRMIGFGLFPTWSPNKTKDQIAFQKARARGSRWFSVWTMDLIDGEARSVTEVAVSSNSALVCPAWAPDGKRLTFATIVEPAHKEEGAQQDIWTISTDGTNRHRITDGNGNSAMPYWAADNRIYFISDRSGTQCIWSAHVDSANLSTAGADTKELGN
jgi:Tol biopolymer transport system component